MEKLSLLLEKADVPVKILNYPEIRQSTGGRCGISCVQTILQYYGENYREDQLMSSLRHKDADLYDDKESASVNNIISLFEEKEFKIDAKKMNINELISYINREIPVIILIQAWGDKDDYANEWQCGHYVVAIGYTRNKILFEDPSTFQVTYLTYEDLMTRWHDEDDDKKYINFGIAIYGKRRIFNKNKWIEIG